MRFKAMHRLSRRRLRLWVRRVRTDLVASRILSAAETPLRATLFSAEQMRTHARLLATSHQLSDKPHSASLLARLDDNWRVLRDVHHLLALPLQTARRLTPAAEWLLDNFYLIEDQVGQARQLLPPGYVKELPWVDSAIEGGCPRVYDMALAIVAHSDGRIDPETIAEFVSAYQSVTPLDLGELWAIPIMLRLALVENLRRVSVHVAAGRLQRNLADKWALQFTDTAARDPNQIVLVVADLARSEPNLGSAFVAELARKLQGQGASLTLPLSWMEQQLAASGLSIEQLIHMESQQQAAHQLSIGNAITSLRTLGATDWRELVEQLSVVDLALQAVPGDVYLRMDFATRDQYRHAVEGIAKRGKLPELEVARAVAELAAQEHRHVGYYLIAAGVRVLEARLNIAVGRVRSLQRWTRRHSFGLFTGAVAMVTLLATAFLMFGMGRRGVPGAWLAAVGALGALAFSQCALELVNWLATLVAKPRSLPRMDFLAGLPAEARTLVAIPTIFGNAAQLADLLAALEVRFLANRDPHLHFALLSDWPDARQESREGEDQLLDLAEQLVQRLNERYAPETSDRFYLFHRPRRWNDRERLWMGYERKRGKLGELNALLRGRGAGLFSRLAGNLQALQEVRYVITLDTDTELPRDAARLLVATMEHPLNRPRFDEVLRRVVGGYGILQPRVSVSGAHGNSAYSEIFGSASGIDPYTRAVSDVYQDVFAEGSFIGKGIYDIDAFERALCDRFPENRILSHDLLEGCYVRSGVVSDVQLYEPFPLRYSADVSRRHRWIRGDWQIARWMMPTVPLAEPGQRERNPLSALSRWKIFDNLRRSLAPPALVALLILGWCRLPLPWLWSWLLVGLMAMPLVLSLTVELLHRPENSRWQGHLANVWRSALRSCKQLAFQLFCLPYEAFYGLDAILRSLLRLQLTGRGLLEWRPAADFASQAEADAASFSRAMWFGPALSCAVAVYLAFREPIGILYAAPLLIAWFASPGLAAWVSRPRAPRSAALSVAQLQFLRRCARRTWSFFETFVTAEDHHLPPDNFQEQPVRVVAHRTSPTNMGLSLLANLTAHDLGYVSCEELLERTRLTLGSMARLERYRGHFYNWYDTQSLAPLLPLYVSTVDSGNLAAHLLTLRVGILALIDEPIAPATLIDGIGDTARVLAESASAHDLPAVQRLLQHAETLPPGLSQRRQWLQEALHIAEGIDAQLEALSDPAAGNWSGALVRQCTACLNELEWLAPWLTLEMPDAALPGWQALMAGPTLRQLATATGAVGDLLAATSNQAPLHAALIEAGSRAQTRIDLAHQLAAQAAEFSRMDVSFLYNRSRRLFTIGYNVSDHRSDAGVYDLLASEARLATFMAIADGQIPQDSWFALSRKLTMAAGDTTLVSWSGSMFEYLMPLLVMPEYPNTLLHATCRSAVRRQIEYGAERDVPWGISESGYNTVDTHRNYQYRAFGVPGLGLMRGLADDLVIAPYATALALLVLPEEACANLERLAAEDLVGAHGFYEAVDYTPARVPRGQTRAVVRSYMAHHQGMSLLSFAHLLLNAPMQRRFAAEPMFQATTLLLQEKPAYAAIPDHREELTSGPRGDSDQPEMSARVFSTAHTAQPEVQLLSNGRYHVMVTNAGGGYSRWNQLAVTRWREDPTRDHYGTFIYLRDLETGVVWSAAAQPTGQAAQSYEAIFTDARAEFRRVDHGIECHTEIAVSPEDDVELRRIRLHNRGSSARRIEVTSYAEVVLQTAAADELHPAFGNLFIETEILRDRQAIICTRRPRSASDAVPRMFHLMHAVGATSDVSYETDRARFIGRDRTLALPAALAAGGTLTDSSGSVLDPIVAIRHVLTIGPEETVTLNAVFGYADTQDGLLSLVGKYQDANLAGRVFDLAWTHSQVTLRHINATEGDAQLYASLAGAMLYASPALRADASALASNKRGQPRLWPYSISGDLPIMLVRIADVANIDLVRQAFQAHAYWRSKGLAVDLVILNEDTIGYRQVLHDRIMGLAAAGIEASMLDKPGGLFVRAAEQMIPEDRLLMQAVARIMISDRLGGFAEQLEQRARRRPPRNGAREIAPVPTSSATVADDERHRDLLFFNGLGGFTPDGREYRIVTGEGRVTPAPWVNVLANARFGTIVTESGAAYTWSENAQAFRLTPWNNDPVGDLAGEAYYIKDEVTGEFWSPMPLPRRDGGSYVTRHGFGYSAFEHTASDIRSETWVYVDVLESVKYVVVKLHNQSMAARRLSVCGYVEWVLADTRSRSLAHLVTELDAESGAVVARNAFNSDFEGRVAFYRVSDPSRSFTADRTEFIGRNGSLQAPVGLTRPRLSSRVGPGLDSCAALSAPVELAPLEKREVVFVLGAAPSVAAARMLAMRTGNSAFAGAALQAVHTQWNSILGGVQVETPDAALNVMANGWLPYQVLASRVWARSGFYQSGGAFGFRDQLQDVMALLHARPDLAREQLLRCASRQFPEGDVQHWWHPPSGRGVRTHISDDFLWMPLVAARYLQHTGDDRIFDELVPFIEGPPVAPEVDSHYDLPRQFDVTLSFYDHCVRAVLHGLRYGAHGLPLMGGGDWNDGMNLVGHGGKGESVWLGFFLYEVLQRFAEVARHRGDDAFVAICETDAATLRRNLHDRAWDGHWYRRAYFDNGEALGSAANSECQIDSIAQSWSVLSGAGDPARSRAAMDAADQHLVVRDAQLIRLLTPPFNNSEMNPGYIKGYVPGVRENGGQYTHAAVWTVMAFAQLGDAARAWELFEMINPVHHGATAAEVAVYKVEPYVIAADVYAVEPHVGRGGWSWYTGSAAWMYRLILETLLGLQRHGNTLRFKPCFPVAWRQFRVRYQYGKSSYQIQVREGAAQEQGSEPIQLIDDGQRHEVQYVVARAAAGQRDAGSEAAA